MQHALLIVDESLLINKSLMDYIYRSYEEHFGEIKAIFFYSKGDKELPFEIEKLSRKYKSLSIITSKDSFPIVSKIVATLSNDSLSLQNDFLAPSNASIIFKNSFLVNLFENEVNVLKVCELDKMPSFLCQNENTRSYFSILGMDEESCKILLEPMAKTFEVKIIISAMTDNWFLVQVTSNKYGKIEGFLQSVDTLFSNKIIFGKDPIKYIIDMLRRNQKTITVAESCTGGLIASKITSYSGSSEIFEGSLITYSNRIKNSWLRVDNELLELRGAVSEDCVKQMLQGSLKATNADFAVATSGIAGPNGGSDQKPVGTVFIGVASKDNIEIERLNLKGDRKYIQEQSVLNAFLLLIRANENFFLTK